MQRLSNSAKLLVVGVLAMVGSMFFPVATTAAEHGETAHNNLIALDVESICSSDTNNTAYWKVTNKNAEDVTVNWLNTFNNQNGSHTAPAKVQEPASESIMETSYDGTDRNNRTEFTFNAESLVSRNARDHRDGGCENFVNTEPACIGGSIQQNLVITWINKNTVSINTKDNQPLCENVDVFFSSYVMPDNYNGQAFEGNTTAYPQTKHDSAMATLQKGTNGLNVLQITLPEECKNTQVDVYYGPEIVTVGENGHGTQNIESKIYRSNGDCEQTPGNGGEQPTDPGDTDETSPIGGSGGGPNSAPVKVEEGETVLRPTITAPAQLPAQLPATGSSGTSVHPVIVTLLASVTAYGLTLAYTRRQQI